MHGGDALAVMGNSGNAALNDPPYAHCHLEVCATTMGAPVPSWLTKLLAAEQQ